jgi:hypothetical protein
VVGHEARVDAAAVEQRLQGPAQEGAVAAGATWMKRSAILVPNIALSASDGTQ